MTKQEELKAMAMGLGACEKGLDNWQAPTDAELIERYIKHLGFCVKWDYPSVEYIEAHFDKELLHKNGIFVNEEIFTTPTLRCVVNGKCSGDLEYRGVRSQTLYIRHESEVGISAKGNNSVFVHLYDNARLSVKTGAFAKVYVYQHGGTIDYQEGNVIVRERRKEELKK